MGGGEYGNGVGNSDSSGANNAVDAASISDYAHQVFAPRSNEIVVARLGLQSVTLRGLRLVSVVITVGSI